MRTKTCFHRGGAGETEFILSTDRTSQNVTAAAVWLIRCGTSDWTRKEKALFGAGLGTANNMGFPQHLETALSN